MKRSIFLLTALALFMSSWGNADSGSRLRCALELVWFAEAGAPDQFQQLRGDLRDWVDRGVDLSKAQASATERWGLALRAWSQLPEKERRELVHEIRGTMQSIDTNRLSHLLKRAEALSNDVTRKIERIRDLMVRLRAERNEAERQIEALTPGEAPSNPYWIEYLIPLHNPNADGEAYEQRRVRYEAALKKYAETSVTDQDLRDLAAAIPKLERFRLILGAFRDTLQLFSTWRSDKRASQFFDQFDYAQSAPSEALLSLFSVVLFKEAVTKGTDPTTLVRGQIRALLHFDRGYGELHASGRPLFDVSLSSEKLYDKFTALLGGVGVTADDVQLVVAGMLGRLGDTDARRVRRTIERVEHGLPAGTLRYLSGLYGARRAILGEYLRHPISEASRFALWVTDQLDVVRFQKLARSLADTSEKAFDAARVLALNQRATATFAEAFPTEGVAFWAVLERSLRGLERPESLREAAALAGHNEFVVQGLDNPRLLWVPGAEADVAERLGVPVTLEDFGGRWPLSLTGR